MMTEYPEFMFDYIVANGKGYSNSRAKQDPSNQGIVYISGDDVRYVMCNSVSSKRDGSTEVIMIE